MGQRAFEFEKNMPYHIYNRGYNKQKLFYSPQDYERFLDALDKYTMQFPTLKIQAFCLLPNHFHFLIEEESEGVSDLFFFERAEYISQFMHRLQLSYSTFFNYKYGEKIKKGLKSPIFEGRFEARMILDDEYLSHLKNYIEWNSVKHGIVNDPYEWPYSSFQKKDGELHIPEDFDPLFY